MDCLSLSDKHVGGRERVSILKLQLRVEGKQHISTSLSLRSLACGFSNVISIIPMVSDVKRA